MKCLLHEVKQIEE